MLLGMLVRNAQGTRCAPPNREEKPVERSEKGKRYVGDNIAIDVARPAFWRGENETSGIEQIFVLCNAVAVEAIVFVCVSKAIGTFEISE